MAWTFNLHVLFFIILYKFIISLNHVWEIRFITTNLWRFFMYNLKNDLINKLKERVDYEITDISFLDDSDNTEIFIDDAIHQEVASLGLDYEDEYEFLDEYEDDIKEQIRNYMYEKSQKHKEDDLI